MAKGNFITHMWTRAVDCRWISMKTNETWQPHTISTKCGLDKIDAHYHGWSSSCPFSSCHKLDQFSSLDKPKRIIGWVAIQKFTGNHGFGMVFSVFSLSMGYGTFHWFPINSPSLGRLIACAPAIANFRPDASAVCKDPSQRLTPAARLLHLLGFI